MTLRSDSLTDVFCVLFLFQAFFALNEFQCLAIHPLWKEDI